MPIPASLASLMVLSTAIAAVAVLVVGSFRSTIELLPFAKPAAPSHDLALKAVNLLMNALLLYVAAVLTGELPSNVGIAIASIFFLSLVQAFGGDAGYNALKTIWQNGKANDSSSAAPLAQINLSTTSNPASAPATPVIVAGGALDWPSASAAPTDASAPSTTAG